MLSGEWFTGGAIRAAGGSAVKLITGLTGPLGMAVSPVATRKFPEGTVFLIEAWAPMAEADGTEVKDPSVRDPKIIAFNTDGENLGAIKMAAGSPAAAAAGVIVTLGNAYGD
jgi:hypothetical protein